MTAKVTDDSPQGPTRTDKKDAQQRSASVSAYWRNFRVAGVVDASFFHNIALLGISMSVPGQATEHARAESFLKTVKYEEVYVHRSQTFEEAQAHLQTFLEEVYNAKRLHSSLDDVPPDEFEANSLKC